MKFLIILLLSISLALDDPFVKFIKIIPTDWTYEKNDRFLIITRKDSFDIKYCNDVSPLRDPHVEKVAYKISIEATAKFSNSELKRRKFLQDSIQNAYQKNHNLIRDKITYSRLEHFKHHKNYIDTLRLPFYSNSTHSYFIKYSINGGYTILDPAVSEEIGNFEKRIFKIK